jgi:predicted amidophosphoribosyltransferase
MSEQGKLSRAGLQALMAFMLATLHEAGQLCEECSTPISLVTGECPRCTERDTTTGRGPGSEGI